MRLRRATLNDAPAIATIYNQGIEDRVATFETRLRTSEEVEQWFDGVHPIVVLEAEKPQVIAFASTSLYRPRPCYAGKALVLGLCRTGLARAWCRSPGIGGAPTGSGESWLLEVGVTGVCRKHGEPRAAPLTRLSRGGRLRKARPVGRHMA